MLDQPDCSSELRHWNRQDLYSLRTTHSSTYQERRPLGVAEPAVLQSPAELVTTKRQKNLQGKISTISLLLVSLEKDLNGSLSERENFQNLFDIYQNVQSEVNLLERNLLALEESVLDKNPKAKRKAS